jgi:signal transduction histidine kinase
MKSKIINSLILVSTVGIVSLYFLLPIITEQNTIDIYTKNSKTIIEQIKLNREYYSKYIVADIKANEKNIKFDYNHATKDATLPFPTTTIHDLSKIYSQYTQHTFTLYSEYPFKPNINRILSQKQKDILKYTQNNSDGTFVEIDEVDGKKVLHVAVTDFMTDISCVNCHNTHPDKTWSHKWKLGDRRGVIEIITPLDDAIVANDTLRDKVVIAAAFFAFLLLAYYVYVVMKRESELLQVNETLDMQVKDEIEKNIQNEKLILLQNRNALLGEMLASIIHQLKQPLSIIKACTGSMSTQSIINGIDNEFLEKQLNYINKHVDQMSITMDDFKGFFIVKPKERFDINEPINKVLHLLGNIYKNQNIIIETKLESNLFVKAYGNELIQVIINLINNARDQIHETQCSNNSVIISSYLSDEHIYISVKDFAGGIKKEILDKIFEPYFTTKDSDKGTGIGLDICKTIINKSNGTISVKNHVSIIDNTKVQGAQFIICFERSLHE